jgi:hypothetical protein
MELIGFPNYTINELGEVANICTGKILATCVNPQTGYRMVSLWRNNKEKKETIHRLLATHFIANPDNKGYVDHIDRNKLNNALSNLRWVNGTENNLNNGGQDRDLHNIYWKKSHKVYRVHLQRYGTTIKLGQYKNIEDARAVRDYWYACQ